MFLNFTPDFAVLRLGSARVSVSAAESSSWPALGCCMGARKFLADDNSEAGPARYVPLCSMDLPIVRGFATIFSIAAAAG